MILHAHWQPPATPLDDGGVLFWAESAEGPGPASLPGRLAQNPRPRHHPFCAPQAEVCRILNLLSEERDATLRLPTTRSGPVPSPKLAHPWNLDTETRPTLAPWIVRGAWLPAADAALLLAVLPSLAAENSQLQLGEDARLWHKAASLVLEGLAAQKLVPVLVRADARGQVFLSRWQPILDGPKDAPRLAQLEAAMPPVCRSEAAADNSSSTPRILLGSFLNAAADGLARRWGSQSAAQVPLRGNEPGHAWLAALLRADPAVQVHSSQAQALAASHRAWMRNLHLAGDTVFRIAFRLEAPAQESIGQPDSSPAIRRSEWRLHYLLQARDDPSLLIPAETVWKTRGSVLRQLNRRFEQPQEKLLAGLGYAARIFAPILETLKGKQPAELTLDTQGAYTFLRQAAPLMEQAGFGLLAPPWWNQPGSRLGVRLRLRPKNSARDQGSSVISKGKLGLENLINYQWELSLGDTSLTEAEFRALAELKSPLVQIRGQWVQLDSEQIEGAIRFWEKQRLSGEFGLLDALQFQTGAVETQDGLPVEGVTSEGWIADWMERFTHAGSLIELPQPAGLHGKLRPYQQYGFSWLAFLQQWGLGACLADDMGLGKTLQTIALLLKEKENLGSLPAPVLLVCPTSVVTNWEREIRRFAPSLISYKHQGANRLRSDEFLQAARPADIVLTSYPLVRQDAETLQAMEWWGVILDEAQNIKNPSARQTQEVRKLQAAFRVALTGTPVENRLSELWSIMHFLNPGYLGPREKFRREFALPIERYNDDSAAQRLKRFIGPFILRRVKTDPQVIQDLPEKIEVKDYCHLTEEQASLYEAVVQDALKQIEEREGTARRGQVLSMLMQLKQVCNHPAQYLHQAGREAGPQNLAGRSGKLERISEMLEEILAGGSRALVFTQFAEMGELLAGYLPKALGCSVSFLHGGVPAKARDEMVRRFQEEEQGPPIFILSLKAGGTGLNLTRANHVFHFDRWWNPAVEDQATDRAFRIGQKQNVQVHKFVTTGTLEEMIDDMIESKKSLAQAVLGSGEGWLTELSTDALRELVRLRR